jgi:inosine-uridine nucleoside N-ribohydrolase
MIRNARGGCQMTRHLLIDTDPGIDDALAILLALRSADARVEAVTTVAGNVAVDRATANARLILAVAAPEPRPLLAAGAAAPLKRALVTAGHVHGQDGLGNLERFVEPDGRPRYPEPPDPIEMRSGPEMILEAADRWGADLTIVALGPLTNVALALQQDPRRLGRAGRIVVMGGAIAVPGNVTPAAEFNFYVDPEAAAAVLDAGLPVELVPLDVTRRVVLAQAALTDQLRRCSDRVARFILDFTLHGFAWGAEREGGGIVLHDPLAMAVALDPSLVTFEPLSVEVECKGKLTRGLSLADRREIPSPRKRGPTCRVAVDVDAERVLGMVLERLCPVSV